MKAALVQPAAPSQPSPRVVERMEAAEEVQAEGVVEKDVMVEDMVYEHKRSSLHSPCHLSPYVAHDLVHARSDVMVLRVGIYIGTKYFCLHRC